MGLDTNLDTEKKPRLWYSLISRKNYHSEVFITKITDNNLTNQLPKAIQSIFKELNILHYLRQAGITKSKGYSACFIFTYIFNLVFESKSLFHLLQSRKEQDGPRKDAIYRFYDDPKKNWRHFLLSLSASVISKISSLTHHDRPKVLVLDDSAYKRDHSKKVELLARCFDHNGTTPGFYKGFRMLTLGWTDGATFYTLAAPKGGSSSILRSIYTEMANGIKVKIVFVRNRNKKENGWLY